MTTLNDKAALPQSPSTFAGLYPIATYQDATYLSNHYPAIEHLALNPHHINEPGPEYSANGSTSNHDNVDNDTSDNHTPNKDNPDKHTPDLATLRDQLENHLARYHFHQLSLLAISHSDDYKDNSHWEFGAYLSGRELQKHSDELMHALTHIKSEKQTPQQKQ